MEEAPDSNPEIAEEIAAPEPVAPEDEDVQPSSAKDAQPEPEDLVPPESMEPSLGPQEEETAPATREGSGGSDRSRFRGTTRLGAEPSSRRMSKFRRSTSGLQSLQETLKEKQARFKEAREGRRMKINSAYKYIFEILSEKLGLDIVTIEELILDGPTLEPFDSFFAKDGARTLKLIYQEGDAPGVGKC
ncbi:dynein axonemal heavy chain 8-like [Anolis carolinensis]|uniref:dynein axonemal heavy chain 8-like n=1 Tax=Anolis carolinensis TaxID=28377 RepID=UPI002F2B804B